MSEKPANTIWQEIQRFAAPCEIDSLYSTIGPDIIEENEALYAEASTLAEILDQFTASGNTEKRKVRPPPEHPSKKFLEEQIFLLLKRQRYGSLKATQGIADYDARVKEYVLRKHGASLGKIPRDKSDSTSEGRSETKITTKDKLSSIKERINVYDVDSVLASLRSALAEEKDELNQFISQLQGNVETSFQNQQVSQQGTEPTIQELKECSERLEGAWIMESEINVGRTNSYHTPCVDIVPTPPDTPKQRASPRYKRKSKRVSQLRREVMLSRETN